MRPTVGLRDLFVLNHSIIETGDSSIAVLVVSRMSGDHEALRLALRGSKWKLYRASDVLSARRQLRRYEDISLVVCEREFWKEVLAAMATIPNAPLVIVAASAADEQLWAEALNIGAYDVLAKPFETSEVVRSLSLGWLHHRRELKRTQTLEVEQVS